MQVVLLQRVENLGQMGEVVTVKPGYARNFLIPRKKALRATKENLAYFEAQRKALETANANSKKDAEAAAGKMTDVSVVIIRQAAESGKLYGSVSARDVSEALAAKGYKVSRDQIELSQSVKDLGLFTAKITLHPEVTVNTTVNVARSEEEAKAQVERAKEPKKAPEAVEATTEEEAPATEEAA
jgi:large subunit ribosomal protein L9